MRSSRLAAILLLVLGVSAGAAPAHAQFFGKNKVQYEPLDWRVLETAHLRLHFYAEEESLARRLAPFAESTCVEYDRRFRLEPKRKIPILLYSAHHLFQQTNATPGLVSEAVGGLTELIKGRVLIPHNGSWARLEWVTRHELTHAYTIEKIGRVMHAHHRTQIYFPPLWFTEGIAEYCGTTWDADAEGLLRDAVLSGEAEPLTSSDEITGTVLMYKEGQSFLLGLGARYGDARIFDLFDNWYRCDDFETVFKLTYGKTLKEADQEWFESLRRRYYPVVGWASRPGDLGPRLTHRGRFNLGPRVLPSRRPADSTVTFCYFRAGEEGIQLVLSEPGRRGARHERKLLSGGQSASFESFHLFQNRPTASPDGHIALSSKHGGRDALYVIEARTGRVVRRLEFPELVAINNPALVPGDSALVFSAQDYGGRCDLYRASWHDDQVTLEQLTRDDADDQEPDVSPDGRWVAFASDRGEPDGRYSLYRLSLAGGVPERLSTPASGDDRQPVYSPDGRWIAFRSTRGGTSDLWIRDAAPCDSARRVTWLRGPASDPDWLANGRGLLYTAQSGITFQTYEVKVQPESLRAEPETPGAASPGPVVASGATPVAHPAATFTGAAEPYQRRLGLDLVQNAIAVDPAFGGAGAGGQIAFSDLLGDEQYYLSLANYSENFGTKFWDSFEGGLTYINQSRRLSYGVGLFHLAQVYDPDLDLNRIERRNGVLGLASYPFNLFTRIEASLLVRHAANHLLRNGEFRDADLVSNFLTLVHDNTRWTWLGPAGGMRMFGSAGYTRDMSSGAGDFGTLVGELRTYVAPVAQFIAASRAQGQMSFGRDAQRFYLGGGRSLPGYDPRTLAGLRTVLLQQEVRFPLLSGLTLALPAPWVFPTVSGVGFANMAWAWDAGGFVPVLINDPVLAGLLENQEGLGAQGHLGSVGAGFFIGGGYFPALRWNYAWPTQDFKSFGKRPRTQFTLGFNF